ncbi:MAG TPA: phage terminase large subunit family protein [Dongiaceae bacterium]|nr:phage terminase large subunit family protein [Dongiaceae bacterium]
MNIPRHPFPKLRPYQVELKRAYFDPNITELDVVIARRGAKTTTLFSECIVPDLIQTVQTIVLVYPTKKIGFNNFWNNIEDDGFRTLDHLPRELVASSNNTEDNMMITLINGSVLMLLGAKDADALRGANGKKYIFDEMADQYIEAVDVVAPIVKRNKGKMVFAGTPKFDGRNGETMRKMWEAAEKNPKKWRCYIDGSYFMTPEEMEELRQDYMLRNNGNDFKFRQEIMLDWGQTSESSYYGSIITFMKKKKRIGIWPYNAKYPVFTSWDLGTDDATAIIFWQYIDKVVHIIDYYETNNIGYEPIINFLKLKPYVYKWHFIPHDGSVREQSDATTRLTKLQSLGLGNASLVKRESVGDGINRVVENLAKAFIHAPMTAELTRKASLYQRKKNGLTGEYMGPEHDTNSHASDALRYLYAAIEQTFDKESGRFFYDDYAETATYETDFSEEYEATYR